jgi:hypothetical protein
MQYEYAQGLPLTYPFTANYTDNTRINTDFIEDLDRQHFEETKPEIFIFGTELSCEEYSRPLSMKSKFLFDEMKVTLDINNCQRWIDLHTRI